MAVVTESSPLGQHPARSPPTGVTIPSTGNTLHHPNLLLLMALSSLADLLGLCLLFEPVWLVVLEALLFLQAHCHAHGGLSSHAVQLVLPGLAKVSSLKHGSHCTSAGCGPGLSRTTPGLPLPSELNCTCGCHLSSSVVICLPPPQTTSTSASWPRRSSLARSCPALQPSGPSLPAGNQGFVEQCEQKFSANMPALQRLWWPTLRAARLDPQP
ncbi:hypothetical protein mRhiFer1_009165 [Rhinolophus ferrumequinum]|uniref:Uncharacterized protein n=1 Tax=Rhinolophus ferrumequinum TaxID=59479 RepID=A0A7J7SJC3_RHIFE|nr:hypothetical protein mRhiFer1_009165 [Rhinolophus ferrumequinum]